MQDNTVHVSLAGGLGNQFFQIAAALSSTNGPVVVHNFLGNARLNQTGEPDIKSFDLPMRIQFTEEPKLSRFGVRLLNLLYRTSVDTNNLLGNLIRNSLLIKLISSYFSRFLDQKVQVVHASDVGFFDFNSGNSSLLLIGYFQSRNWPESPQVLNEFRNMALKDKKSAIIAKLAEDNRVLALHIRLGDYAYEPRIGVLSAEYFERSIAKIATMHSFHEIWLFSDEPSKAINFVPENWAHLIRVVPEASSAATLNAMRDADYYVISNSTFSWWGAFLSRTDQKVVVAPYPWFKGLSTPRELIPLEWIKSKPIFVEDQNV